MKTVIFMFDFTPVLRVIKDGCVLDDFEFVVVKSPVKIRRLLYHTFRILGLSKIALWIYTPEKYRQILKYRNEDVSAVFWSIGGMAVWRLIGKLINPAQKNVFQWGPMNEIQSGSNKIFKRILSRIERARKEGFSFFTYCPYDAERYKMNLTSQVYRRNWNFAIQTDRCDFYFIGKTKGRRGILDSLRNALSNKGYFVDFRIFDDLPKEFVPYDENVRLTMGTRCIVDIVAKKYNAGMTLRPLEALFFKKKLLTNDESVRDCDFYHPDNIFIIDENNICLDGIEEFMLKPFHAIDESIVDKYEVNNWLRRYFLV